MSLFTGSSRLVLDNNNITGVGRDFNITVTTHEPAADVVATLLGKRKERDGERDEDVHMFEKRRRSIDSGERRSDGLMLVERDQLNLLGELVSGADYQTHYASHRGRAVAVKVFEGPRAKQYCADNVAFSKKFLHSNVLKIVGVSKHHESPFIVFHGIIEKRIQSLIAKALQNDLSRSVQLAMKTVKGLASGLNYLKTQKIPLHNLDVFAGNNEEPVILIHFPSTGVGDQSNFGLESEGNGITALNGLCQKVSTFQAYLLSIAEDGDEIQLFSETNSVLYDDSPEREIGTYDSKGLPISLSRRDSKGGSNPIERESTPSKSGEQLQTSQPPRREVWWHDIGTSDRSLDVIARRFQDYIDCLLSLRRIIASKDSYTRRISHDCPGYLREEITLTSDISRCAIVSHTLPSESELCSICGQLVHYQIEMEEVAVEKEDLDTLSFPGGRRSSELQSPLIHLYDPYASFEIRTPSPSYSNSDSPLGSTSSSTPLPLPREVRDFERALTAIYCTSAYARERRPKNIVQSITWCKEENGLQHEYLVVNISNHNSNDFTTLRLERTRSECSDSTNLTTPPLPASSSGVEAASPSHEVANIHRRPHRLNIRSSSTPSIRTSKSYFGAYPAMDIIEVFYAPGKGKGIDLGEILFVNNDFTLHDLSMIAKVVQDVRAKYNVHAAHCYWFTAVIVQVAMGLYKWTRAEPELGKCRGISFLNVSWGANDPVNAAIPQFKKLQKTFKEKIEAETNSAEAFSRAQAMAEAANAKAKQAEQKPEQAQKQAQRSQQIADQAKRDVQERDVEIARLRGLLSRSVVQGTVKHGS